MKKLVFSLFVCGFILAGCKNEPVVAPDGDRQIVVFFSAPSVSASLLKATGDVDETISKVILFGVDGTDTDVVAIDDPILEDTDLEDALDAGTVITLSKRIKTLYAIANPSDDLETYLETASILTLTDLLALTDDFSDEPDPSNLLMSGKGTVTDKSAKIDLLRAVAKVVIVGLNEFDITSVQVMNTPDNGYVFEQETFSIPDPLSTTDYDEVEFTDPDDEKIFYVAESELPGTEFVVTGSFNGKEATYTIKTLNKGATFYNLVRNRCYTVGLSPLTEDEVLVTIEITDWIPVEVDEQYIPDDNFVEP